MILEEAATAEIMMGYNPEKGLYLPEANPAPIGAVDAMDQPDPLAYTEHELAVMASWETGEVSEGEKVVTSYGSVEDIVSAETAADLEIATGMREDEESGLILPVDRSSELGLLTKTGNFLRRTRAGRAITAFAIGTSLAGVYSLINAETAKADVPPCVDSVESQCSYTPPPNPPSGGNQGNDGNNGSGHQGSGNNGNGNGSKTHHDGKVHLSDYYQDPLRDVHNLVPWRIDEGVDYHGHGPVYAIGEGIVTLATRSSNFWANEKGNAVVYRLTEGPAKGLKVFVSENCTPRVHKHQRVHPSTVVCKMHGDAGPPGIETGWAMLHHPGKEDYPAAQPVYSEGDKTAYGANYDLFAVKLGSPKGNSVYPHVSSTSYKVGSIPHRYKKLVKLPK